MLQEIEAGDYVIEGVSEGTHTVSVESVYQGFYSEPLEVTDVTVTSGFSYESSTTEGSNDARVFDNENENGKNLVRNEGVTAEASSGNANNAIDNDGGSRWESEQSDPQELTVILDKAYMVKEINSVWETANAKDYTVQVSTDGSQYHVAATVKEAAAGANRLDKIVFKEPVEAKYVKILGTARTTNYGYSIYEIAIYGSEMGTSGENYYAPGDLAEYLEDNTTYPDKGDETIFAGWYLDSEFNTPYDRDSDTGKGAYAKFIDEKVLDVKAQVSEDNTSIRFVSTVDNLNYDGLGFKVEGSNGSKDATVDLKLNSVFSSLNANGESVELNTFSDQSSYFFAYAINGMSEGTTYTWKVTPYWTTEDGAVVTGTQKTFKVPGDGSPVSIQE